jgi:predicted DNA binding CopG/RHH family protein
MSDDHWDSLIDRDWSAAWETLPEAPALVPRRKTAQITLRVPAGVLIRIKRLAAARSLPYHALARSWIVNALRIPTTPETGPVPDQPQTEQLNIKLDQEILDQLKGRSNELRRPYHRLAREWIEAALSREEESLGLDPAPARQPALKDLMILLLHSTNKSGADAIRGVTHLQKLLFVLEQNLTPQSSRFYAFNYGPFSEEVNDAAQALRLAGFLKGAEPVTTGLPSFAEMMATALERSGPRDKPEAEEFALSERGHEAAERLRQSNRAYDELYVYIRTLREEWDTPDLVERVYEAFPQYTERSMIREQVAKRRARRRSGPS